MKIVPRWARHLGLLPWRPTLGVIEMLKEMGLPQERPVASVRLIPTGNDGWPILKNQIMGSVEAGRTRQLDDVIGAEFHSSLTDFLI